MTVLIKVQMALPKLTRSSTGATKDSIYNLGELQEGEAFLIQDVVDIKKSKSKLQSAIGAYRARTNDKQTVFAVRSFKNEDGTDGVGVWRVPAKVEADAATAADAPAAE